MLIEAVDKPVCYRWPDGEVQLVAGHPVDLPEARALRLLQRAPGKVRLVSTKPSLAVRPGDRITWQGADRTDRSGVVDCLHPDADGTLWAFCATPDGWCAVNVTVAGVTMERATP